MKSYAVCIDTTDVGQTGKYNIYLIHALESNGISVVLLKSQNDSAGNTWHGADAVVIGSRHPLPAEMEIIRKQSKPIIYLMASDPIVGDIERFSYPATQQGERIDFIRECDSIWLTDNFQHHLSYVEAIYKRPVKVIPNLWDNSFTATIDKVYNSKVNSGPLNIIILESNTSFNTSGWKQLVICEQLYLQNKNAINEVFVFNTPDSNNTSMGMIRSLTLKADGKLRIFKALPIKDIVSFFMDKPNVVFLGNQTFDDLSYNYYDILNAGYNVVHSSVLLKTANVGRYYDNLDIQGAIQNLLGKNYDAEANLIKNRMFLRSLRLSDASLFQ